MTPIGRLALASLLATVALASATGQFGPGRKILVGYYDAKPSCWRDAASKPAGIFIDVAKAVAARRGWELSFVFDSWDGLLERLRTNRVDFVPAIVRTAEREAYAVFTEESVMTDWGAVYARRGGPIRSILDLDGRKVGALRNDFWFSGAGSLRSLASSFALKPEYRYYEDYSSLFAALGKGEVDAAAASNSLGIVWEAVQPVVATPVIYNPIELRFAAPRFSPEGAELAKEMDAEIRSLRAREPEFLRQLLAAYSVPVRKVYRIPLWIALVLASLSLVLVAIIAALGMRSRELKRSVARTKAALERLDEARRALEIGLREKELLVHELSHRVKNNLQLVLSLMGLLADDPGEPRERTWGELREKVHAIAQAEDELFASGGIGQASMESFVSSLISRAVAAERGWKADISSRIDLRGATIAAAAVIPFSLIASELVANACRHGGGAGGSLRALARVETTEDGGGEIELRDEGPGLAGAIDPSASPGLGYRLVAALVSQIGGSLEISDEPGGGTRVIVRVPRENWSASGHP
jgi:two-component sensor histidine kinase/ABC-type amino acid transport substrate-binding protein